MKRPAWLGLIVAAILLLIVFLANRLDLVTSHGRQPDTSKEPTLNRAANPDGWQAQGRHGEGSRAQLAVERRSHSIFKKAGPDHIQNEYVFRFAQPADLQKFIQSARDAGIEVLGSIEKFNSVRIRVRDRDQLERLLDEGTGPSDYENNYWVRLPETGNRDVELPEGVYTGFGDRALTWLGVPNDHQTWGRGVTVAVLDTGIEDHPALSGATISRVDLLGADGSATGVYQGHGTAVASLLAGSSPQAAGIAPAASLLSIRVISGDGVGDAFTVASGIVEAVDRGVNIISLSLGSQGDSFILRQAVDYATQKGVAVVASTGNDSIDSVSYPARYPGVLAVTAVDANSRHMFFANRGPEVDLAAPGLGVNAAWSDKHIVSFSGTSAATPFVAGALAALISQTPQLSADEAQAILSRYSDDVGPPARDAEYGDGVLDIERALNRDQRGIYDMAIAGVYADIAKSSVTVSAQNRGTERLAAVQLRVAIDGSSQAFDFSNVEVGQTVSQEFHIDLAKARQDGGIIVRSSVIIRGVEDSQPANNVRDSIITVSK